jgi:hypothetical protein
MNDTDPTDGKRPRYEKPAVKHRQKFETCASGGCVPGVMSGSYCCSGHWDSDHHDDDSHKKKNCG